MDIEKIQKSVLTNVLRLSKTRLVRRGMVPRTGFAGFDPQEEKDYGKQTLRHRNHG